MRKIEYVPKSLADSFFTFAVLKTTQMNSGRVGLKSRKMIGKYDLFAIEKRRATAETNPRRRVRRREAVGFDSRGRTCAVAGAVLKRGRE